MKKTWKVSASAAIGAAILVCGAVAPASALGALNPSCGTTWYYAASWTGGAHSQENGSYDCGTMGVQVKYNSYPGSPSYYTGWVYNATNAVKYQSGTFGANHYNSRTGAIAST
jgi:hypothetical protein